MKKCLAVYLLATAAVAFCLGHAAHAQTPTTANVTAGAPVKIHPIELSATDGLMIRKMSVFQNLGLILTLSGHDLQTFTLVRITNAPPTIGLLDPLDPSKILRSIPHSVQMPRGGNVARWPQANSIASPYFEPPPAYALCLLDAKQLTAGAITEFPDATILIPDDWVADFGKMLVAPNLTADLDAPKETPPNYVFANNWALLEYGYHLSRDDFAEFVKEYPALFTKGDIYNAAVLTDELIKGAVKNKVDVTKELEGAMAGSSAKPDGAGAIIMAVYVNARTYDKAEVQKLVALAQQKAKPGAPEWTNTRDILGLTDYFLQGIVP